MHIHILGICGTLMGSIALLARELGHKVSGSDANDRPPIGIIKESIFEGYDPMDLDPRPDLVIIGNTRALSRGNPMIEYLLREKIPFTSAPQWIYENILNKRWVIAVSGTHGKTTTTAMITWILERLGLNPGYLIGGVPIGLPGSSRLSPNSPYFVIEADEYGSAFFDARPKMLHYFPRTLVINNLEMDHADIYGSLEEIEREFHRLIKMVPGNGLIIHPKSSESIQRLLKKGYWSNLESTGENGNWSAKLLNPDGSSFEIYKNRILIGEINWSLIGGDHSVSNALSALAAVNHLGVSMHQAIEALNSFQNPKKRLEMIGKVKNLDIITDFGHHPTAISTNLRALRVKYGKMTKIYAAIDLSSSSMRLGAHRDTLGLAIEEADLSYFLKNPNLQWEIEEMRPKCTSPCEILSSVEEIIEEFSKIWTSNSDQRAIFIAFSSGPFDDLAQKLLETLEKDDLMERNKEL